MAGQSKTDIKNLAKWIDAHVIAESILERLKEEEVEPTLENAKKVWLDFLETELSDGLEKSIDALLGKGELITVSGGESAPGNHPYKPSPW